jgi:amidase
MTAELGDMDVRALQAALDQGTLSSVELVMALVDRVARLDQAGPRLNAVQVINPDALFIAESLDAERARGRVRGPLHGIPVLLKDNIGTRDKMPTTAGALALEGVGAPMEATLVRRLRQAGAVILGKTHLTEWANFMTHHMPNGYSALGGQVLNPYGPGRFDVGGSSSGSAAAVAAGLAPLAVGTETSGSILNPASNNSVVGIKPTVGAVSRYGIIPIASSQDTAGPMARTVYDAALLLDAMAGGDRQDPATGRGRWTGRLADYARPGRLEGVRVGVVRQTLYRPLEAWVHDRLTEAAKALTELGSAVVDPVSLAGVDDIRDLTVLFYEFRINLNAYLGRLPAWAPVHSLLDVIRFNRERAHVALRYGQTILEEAEALSGRLVEPAYWEARLRDIRVARGAIDGALQSQHLDALVFAGSMGAGVAAKAGYPSVTVPGGYGPEGRPIGVTFTGPAFSEPILVRLAAAFEAATAYRRPPALGESA